MATLRKHELEFLPATLELQETPPSPIGRVITWAIMTLCALALLWAWVGEVDIVAVAQGKIVPSDRVKIIQPLEIGTVHAIHVQEGQRVNAGDTLIEMDTTASNADQSRAQQDLLAAQLERERLTALIARVSGKMDAKPAYNKAARVTRDMVAMQDRMLDQEWQEFQARLSAADEAVAARTAELASAQTNQEKLAETLPLIAQRTDAVKRLAEKQLAATQQYLELEQQRVEISKGLEGERHHVTQLQSAIAQANSERLSLQAEFKRTAMAKLTDAQQRAAGLQQELAKANQRTSLQKLTAPINGVVQQLAVHTIGGVVTPAQELLRIVPLEDHLEIEAFLENKDIGFVGDEQVAAIKVETFPFTKYGMLTGKVNHVSYDAINDEKRGLIYSTRVAMDKATMQVGEKLVQLTPGMAVTVEIKTGTRHLIEFILSPLTQHAVESARER